MWFTVNHKNEQSGSLVGLHVIALKTLEVAKNSTRECEYRKREVCVCDSLSKYSAIVATHTGVYDGPSNGKEHLFLYE